MTVDLASYIITHKTHPVWGKLPAILEAFRKYPNADWVWWLDVDAVIMNPEIDLYEHLLAPSVLMRSLTDGEPILQLNDELNAVASGLRTQVTRQSLSWLIAASLPGPGRFDCFARSCGIERRLILHSKYPHDEILHRHVERSTHHRTSHNLVPKGTRRLDLPHHQSPLFIRASRFCPPETNKLVRPGTRSMADRRSRPPLCRMLVPHFRQFDAN
jgi:hypothetical protein